MAFRVIQLCRSRTVDDVRLAIGAKFESRLMAEKAKSPAGSLPVASSNTSALATPFAHDSMQSGLVSAIAGNQEDTGAAGIRSHLRTIDDKGRAHCNFHPFNAGGETSRR